MQSPRRRGHHGEEEEEEEEEGEEEGEEGEAEDLLVHANLATVLHRCLIARTTWYIMCWPRLRA